MDSKVTVLITVGPNACYKKWLPEAFESAINQTYLPDQILMVDDGAYLLDDILQLPFAPGAHLLCDAPDEVPGKEPLYRWYNREKKIKYDIWQTPWNIGFAPAFNCGVGLSDNDLIMFLAADDKLMPDAIKDCVEEWEKQKNKDGWYGMSFELQDGTTHSVFNNVAMISRPLFRWLNGFPPAGFAAPDAMMISILMVYAPDRLIKVKEGKINCWLRQHSEQETGRQAAFYMASGVVDKIRDMETQRFKPNGRIKLK